MQIGKPLKSCPLGLPIREMLEYVSREDFASAIEFLRTYIPFPGISGCMCKSPCSRDFLNSVPPVSEFERFLYEYELENTGYHQWNTQKKKKSGFSVAIIGAGPAGLFCAYELLRMGHTVTIYDQHNRAGGMLDLAILPSRLPRHVLFSELDVLNKLGAIFEMSKVVMQKAPETLRDLRQKFDAVFLAIGAHDAKMPILPGIDTANVISVVELFERIRNNDRFLDVRNVIVYGDGNDAIGAAITLKTMHKNVGLLHQKRLEKMTADKKSILQAINMGVEFLYMHKPLRVLSQARSIKSLEVERLNIETEGNSEFKYEGGHTYEIDTDLLVVATGRHPFTKDVFGKNLKITKAGFVQINDKNATGIDGIFAGGDCVNSTGGYIYAATSGKNSAKRIHEFLTGEDNEPESLCSDIDIAEVKQTIEISESRSFVEIKSAEQARSFAKIILDL